MSNIGSYRLFRLESGKTLFSVGQSARVGQHGHMSRPGTMQLACTGRYSGAGGHHIIDQHHGTALHRRLARHLERTCDIGGALLAGQPFGADGRLHADQHIDRQRPPGLARDMAGDFGGLVEAALPQPPAM